MCAHFYLSWNPVEGGHRAIIFNKITGTRDTVFGEGTHLKIPFLEEPVIYDIRAKPQNIRSSTGSVGSFIFFK